MTSSGTCSTTTTTTLKHRARRSSVIARAEKRELIFEGKSLNREQDDGVCSGAEGGGEQRRLEE
jgi:hypothetical protein